MNRKERRAAKKTGGPAVTPMAATLAQAFRAHQAGHRSDAERLYRDVLAAEPRNAAALHLLGALLHQMTRSDEAISLMRQAIAIEPRNADYHYNLGCVLNGSGRVAEAIEQLAKAVALNPQYAEAHFELGNAYGRMERWQEAAGQFRRVIALRPNDAAAQNNLALVLREQGALEEAASLWERVTARSSSFPLAQMNLGLIYKAMGRLGEAEAKLREAIEAQPNLPDAHYNLASVLVERDDAGPALQALRRAFESQDNVDVRRLFIRCVTTNTQIPLDPEIEPLLFRALTEDWVNPAQIYALCRAYLEIQPSIAAALKRAESEQRDPIPLDQMLGSQTSGHIGTHRLLLALIASMPVTDTNMERLLARVRFSLLDTIRRQSGAQSFPGSLVELCCAIAQQCFINEYIFNETPEETSGVGALSEQIAVALRGQQPVLPEAIAIIAAYRPLHKMPFAGLLANYGAAPALAAVIRQQIEEPREEQALRGTIESLTPIGDGVSAALREQYEENPCPRWAKTSRLETPLPIDRLIQRAFPRAPYRPLGKAEDLEMLVAGCGTGLDAITASQAIAAAEILAVDLSATGLAFAERQTRALGLTNIRYAQADITHLPSLGRSFDVIEAIGVLHHMEDLWAGWKTLLSLLRPQGVMRIGLCSSLGRRTIAQVQDFVRDGNYQADPEGIRACRRNILRQAAGSPLRSVTGFSAFYTTSECRNLLFGVREQCVSIPEIGTFLRDNRLTFLGFDASPRILRRYSEEHPNDGAMTDLASWHQFETRNPDTFAGLYDFWVQKA
jgi:tetratricopeptide (TPR) repeat protein/2-polyprenyl-3-methyl-5-hydroxy-6-metoxy-1,4-benzoquinol methylase